MGKDKKKEKKLSKKGRAAAEAAAAVEAVAAEEKAAVAECERKSVLAEEAAASDWIAQMAVEAEQEEAAKAEAEAAEKAANLPGADEDGNYRCFLDKKSPSMKSEWQKRWVVMRPDGIWERYMNKEQEGGKAAGLESEDDREPFDLSKCTRFTTNNIESCHFELHGVGKHGVTQLRVSKEFMALADGSRSFARYDKNTMAEIQAIMAWYANKKIVLSGRLESVGKAARRQSTV